MTSFPTEESPGVVPPTNAMLLSASPSFVETDDDDAQRGGGGRGLLPPRRRGDAPAATTTSHEAARFSLEVFRSVKNLELQVKEYQLQASRELRAFQENDLKIQLARERQWSELVSSVSAVKQSLAEGKAREEAMARALAEMEARQVARQSEVLAEVASLASASASKRAPPAPSDSALGEKLALTREELSQLREKYELVKTKAREYQRKNKRYEQLHGKLGQGEDLPAREKSNADEEAKATESVFEQEVAETPPQEACSPIVATAVRVRPRDGAAAAMATTAADEDDGGRSAAEAETDPTPTPSGVEREKEESQPSPGWIPRRVPGRKKKGHEQKHLDEFFRSQSAGDRKRGRARGTDAAEGEGGPAGVGERPVARVIVLDDTPTSNPSSQQTEDTGDERTKKSRPSGSRKEGFNFADYAKYKKPPKVEGKGTPKDFWHIQVTPP